MSDIDNDTIKLFKLALKKRGLGYQLIVAIEENMELSQAITKYIRKDDKLHKEKKLINHIAEEIGDVEIMCAQLKISFNIEKEVDGYKHIKLNRLRKRLELLKNGSN